MEKGLNDQFLEQRQITGEGQKIFVQRWAELFNKRTLDTYQFKILNARGALQELNDVINLVKEGSIGISHLNPVREECLDLFKNDFSYRNNAKALWERMVFNLGRKLKKDKDGLHHGLLQLLYQVRYTLLHTSSNYFNWVLHDLKTAIDGNKLLLVDRLTSSLASELVNMGWSPQSLHGLLRTSFFHRNSFEDKWQSFIEQVSTPKKNWICLYKLKGEDKSHEILEKTGLEVKDGNGIRVAYKDAGVIDRISIDSMYIVKTVSANDLASAVAITNEEIRRSLDILHFCRYGVLEIDKTIVVIFPENIKSITYKLMDPWVSSGTNEASFLRGPFEDLLHVLTNCSDDSKINEKIKGALLYSRLSEESFSLQARFINYWVALESLLKTGQKESLMDHMITVVSSVHCSRYIYRLVRNFIEDSLRCGVQLMLPKGILSDMPRRQGIYSLVEALKDEGERAKLIKQCSSNSLLRLRCQQLGDSLSSGEKVLKLIEGHYKVVSWHLQRLYRLRNSIVHSASSESSNLLPYVRHIYDYLKTVVFEIAFRFKTNDKWLSLGEIFSALEDNYLATFEILKRDKEDYDLSVVFDGPLWENISSKG